MRKYLSFITFFLLLSGCFQNPTDSENSSIGKNKTNRKSNANYCDCDVIHRDDGTDVTQCFSFPVAKDNSLELGLAIASNGQDYFVTVTIRYYAKAMKITDDLHIRLKDNSMITFDLVNEGLSYIGNDQVAQGVFSLDRLKIQKLKSSELMTISIKLEDNLIHTLECTKNLPVLKEQLLCISH